MALVRYWVIARLMSDLDALVNCNIQLRLTVSLPETKESHRHCSYAIPGHHHFIVLLREEERSLVGGSNRNLLNKLLCYCIS